MTDNKKAIIAGSNSCDDLDWDIFTEELTSLMNNNTEWEARVNDFGWRNLDGTKTFTACDGRELLSEILPNTECNFYIFKYYKGFKIRNYHHDSPMGNEYYYIRPVTT